MNIRLFLAKNGIFIALAALVLLFAVINPAFLTPTNLVGIVRQSVELGIIALPLAFLVMTGAIDLSVGAVASMSAVLAGLVMDATGMTVLAIVAALAFGAVAGAINGLLVSYLGLNSMVVTLGFLSVWSGFALLVTDGRTIGRSSLTSEFTSFGGLTIGPIHVSILILVAVALVAWYVLNRTAFGRHVLAVGGNRRAARLMGVNVQRTQFFVFIACSVGAALAGLLLVAKVQSASPNIGSGMELAALTVVLLGGVAFEGGIGRISGVFAGLLFLRVLNNGLIFLGASPFIQTILVGAVLVVAVGLDSTIQRVIRGSWKRARRSAAQAKAGVAA